jgi:hypothetical protein
MTGFDAAAGEPLPSALPAPVYRDPRETSLTLVLLGVAVSISVTAQLYGFTVSAGHYGIGFVPDGLTADSLILAFTILWLMFRRRAAVRGMRRPAGFGLAAIIGLVAGLPPFFVVMVYAGPFVVFALGLLTVGIKLDNVTLTSWGIVVGGIGIFEGFFGITNRLSPSLWAGWEHPVIYLLLGIVTLLGAIIVSWRENRAASIWPGCLVD